MSNTRNCEDLKHRLESAFDPEQAKLLAEVFMESRKTAETTSKEPPSPDELQRRLKRLNRSTMIVVFIEAVALVIVGVLISDYMHTKKLAGFDAFLFGLWFLLTVSSFVVLAILAERRKRLKRVIESASN